MKRLDNVARPLRGLRTRWSCATAGKSGDMPELVHKQHAQCCSSWVGIPQTDLPRVVPVHAPIAANAQGMLLVQPHAMKHGRREIFGDGASHTNCCVLANLGTHELVASDPMVVCATEEIADHVSAACRDLREEHAAAISS